MERCYRDGEGVVTYVHRLHRPVPGFCMSGKHHREVSFQLARSNDASLPEHVRDRMAAAQEVGALELEFQVRLFQGVDAVSGRPMRVCCMVNMMTTGGAVQQPDVTGCTVFNSLGRTGSTTPHN
jgi:hypothetical protein